MARQTGPLRARLEYAAIGALVAPLAAMERERAVRAGARLGALGPASALQIVIGELRNCLRRSSVEHIRMQNLKDFPE
jgi:hypothetical protein